MLVKKIKTKGLFNDITAAVKEAVPQQFTGLVHIFSRHTTAGIRIIENEKLLLADYERILQEFAPETGFYAHNIIEARDVPPAERINGHSHIRALFFNTSETIPAENGKLLLGKWQSIFLVELDPSREREIVVSFL